MKEVKIVIGANFGDEGKGLMTDYFAAKAHDKGHSCIVVCHNGGAQKGHTVETDKMKHVFHHFGSGTFTGAHTFLADKFIVNPMLFREEYDQLLAMGKPPVCYIDPNCAITFPYDMMINQFKEEDRGECKHGSCGLGIYETFSRNFDNEFKMSVCGFKELSRSKRVSFIKSLIERGLNILTKECALNDDRINLMKNENITTNYIDDFNYMVARSILADISLIGTYDTVIFEGNQGLLLDMNNHSYVPHLTPSNTGIRNPIDYLINIDLDGKIEACYVTRTYITRHGAGRLDNECRKEKINPDMIDETNVPNPYQDSLRYSYLNKKELIMRILMDITDDFSDIDYNYSIAVTHTNETEGKLVTQNGLVPIEFSSLFDNIYISDGKTRQDVQMNE